MSLVHLNRCSLFVGPRPKGVERIDSRSQFSSLSAKTVLSREERELDEKQWEKCRRGGGGEGAKYRTKRGRDVIPCVLGSEVSS